MIDTLGAHGRLQMHRTQERHDGQEPTPLEAALSYAARGWSIIPIRPRDKKPACGSWKRYQETPADHPTLHEWFDKNTSPGLAVVLGPVSGGLVCRDFDDMGAYNAWALEHPDLAAGLPTVATARGRHVYLVADWKTIKPENINLAIIG